MVRDTPSGWREDISQAAEESLPASRVDRAIGVEPLGDRIRVGEQVPAERLGALRDDPAAIDRTPEYLDGLRRLLAEEPTPREFFDTIVGRYPDWLNRSPVWYNAHLLLGAPFPTTEGQEGR